MRMKSPIASASLSVSVPGSMHLSTSMRAGRMQGDDAMGPVRPDGPTTKGTGTLMSSNAIDRRTFLATAGVIPVAVRALGAQAPGLEPGFTSLFDGRSLAGWSVQDGPDPHSTSRTARSSSTRGPISRRGCGRRGSTRTSISAASFRQGLDELRHLPPRARARPQHVVRDEDQHLSPDGREPRPSRWARSSRWCRRSR